jgi:hypothetical protein
MYAPSSRAHTQSKLTAGMLRRCAKINGSRSLTGRCHGVPPRIRPVPFAHDARVGRYTFYVREGYERH